MKSILTTITLAYFALTSSGCDKHQSEAKPRAAASKLGPLMVTGNEPLAARGTSATSPTMTATTAATEPASEEGAGCSQWDEAAAEVARRTTPGDAVWATIPVKGMSCGGCERRIVAKLGKVDGILGVEADAELGQVRVAFAPGNDTIAASARTEIQALGYKPL